MRIGSLPARSVHGRAGRRVDDGPGHHPSAVGGQKYGYLRSVRDGGGHLLEVQASESLPPNVWLGTTVEDQRRADERIPRLLGHRSVVRFLSIEPQLGPIDLSRYLHELDWVIAGGESGGGSRPTEVAWARSIRDQCVNARVPFFFKQWGNHVQVGTGERLIRLITKNERHLDGRLWDEIPTPRMQRREPVEAAPVGLSVWERLKKPQVG